MAKITYRKCDICGENISLFKGLLIYKIWNRLFNKIDICNNCMYKIRQLSIDIKEEEKFVNEAFEHAKDYYDEAQQVVYYQGLADMLDVLSHKRLYHMGGKK